MSHLSASVYDSEKAAVEVAGPACLSHARHAPLEASPQGTFNGNNFKMCLCLGGGNGNISQSTVTLKPSSWCRHDWPLLWLRERRISHGNLGAQQLSSCIFEMEMQISKTQPCDLLILLALDYPGELARFISDSLCLYLHLSHLENLKYSP